MEYTKALGAGLLLYALSACGENAAPENTTVKVNKVNRTSQAAQPSQVAQPNPADQVNPRSEARARQLAMQGGSEQERMKARQEARKQLENLRVEVDISDRKLRVFQGDQLKETHDVAVGTKEWPTPTGSWEFHRVDINPEWIPPKSEEWAKDAERQPPGSPDNPMGRARLVYRMPNTVHGTDDLNSLGKASSHGSIRVANQVVLQLAEKLLRGGGAWEGPQWFNKMTQNRTEEYQIPLEQHIPIKVQE